MLMDGNNLVYFNIIVTVTHAHILKCSLICIAYQIIQLSKFTSQLNILMIGIKKHKPQHQLRTSQIEPCRFQHTTLAHVSILPYTNMHSLNQLGP